MLVTMTYNIIPTVMLFSSHVSSASSYVLRSIYTIYVYQYYHINITLHHILFITALTAMCVYNTKQKHLGCKKGKANQKQQFSDYRCIRT